MSPQQQHMMIPQRKLNPFLITLPDYILETFMKYYLTHEEWRNVMNTTKFFTYRKRYSIYLPLNNKYSQEYCLSITFRQRILSLIVHKKSQLSIDLRSTPTIMSKHLSVLDGVHKLDLSNNQQIDDVNMLPNVYILDLSGCSEIKDISKLGKIHQLILPRCYELRSLNGLENVHSINLSSCHFIQDVHSLANAEYLNLSNCPNIADVKPLKNVKELILSSCRGIQGEDINQLIHVKKLDVSYCPNVTEISSSLSNVEIININYCSNMKKIGKLSFCQELSMIGCKQIQDITHLQNIQCIKICKCQQSQFLQAQQQVKQQQQQEQQQAQQQEPLCKKQQQQQDQQQQKLWENVEMTSMCLCN